MQQAQSQVVQQVDQINYYKNLHERLVSDRTRWPLSTGFRLFSSSTNLTLCSYFVTPFNSLFHFCSKILFHILFVTSRRNCLIMGWVVKDRLLIESVWLQNISRLQGQLSAPTVAQNRTSTSAQVNLPCLDATNIAQTIATEVPVVNTGQAIANGATNATVNAQIDASTIAVTDTNTYNGPGIVLLSQKPAVTANNISTSNVPVLVGNSVNISFV